MTTPPHDLQAEQAVLGACMTAPTVVDAVRTVLPDPTTYYQPRHQTLYTLLLELADAGEPTDPIAVKDALERRGELNRTGGPLYLHELQAAHTNAPGDPRYYAAIINRHATARHAQTTLTRGLQRLEAGDLDDITQLVTELRDDLDKTLAETTTAGPHADRIIPAGAWLFDTPEIPEALWGTGDDVLWARGETLLIAGPSGVGKTTLAQQLTLARIGLAKPELLALPVEPARRILYLAMDRPAQARRSLHRMVTPAVRHHLDQHLIIWKGPPPGQIINDTRILLTLARQADADTVVVDSVKDVAVGIAKDDVGAAVNISLQELLAADIDVLALHHIRKTDTAGAGREPATIDEIYGSTWITGGAGSVISLWGAPGDPIVSFKHMKQPAAEVGPYRLRHDQEKGRFDVWHSVNILDILLHVGKQGMTAKTLANIIFPKDGEKNTDAEIEKARRKLDGLVREGLAVRVDPDRPGRGAAARYHAAYSPSGEVPG